MFCKVSLLSWITLVVLSACSILGKAGEPAMSPCPIEDLMIDESLFREGWLQVGPPKERTALIRFGIRKLSVGFIHQQYGIAGYDVYEGENFEETEKRFFEELDYWFPIEDGYTDWYIPRQFSYESTVADHYQFRCYTHKASGVERCAMMGQYGVYLTGFYADMSSVMTYYDLNRILQAIDGKMAKCLAGGTPVK